jgi:hypothetical protein
VCVADRAKQIKTSAKVNESATDKLIRELQEENERLKKMMQSGGAVQLSKEDAKGLSEEGRETRLTNHKRRSSVLLAITHLLIELPCSSVFLLICLSTLTDLYLGRKVYCINYTLRQ